MELKYFSGITDIKDIKPKYKELAKKFHPDVNKENEQKFKELTNEYEYIQKEYVFLFSKLKDEYNADEKHKDRPIKEMPEEFIMIYEALKGMEGVILDVRGRWLWLIGNTVAYEKEIAKLGFKYKKVTDEWYKGEYLGKRHKPWSQKDIIDKHGSTLYKPQIQLKLEEAI